MKMTRNVCLAALAAMAAAALVAAEPVKQKVNLFEKRKEAIARRAEAIRRAGGLVDMPATGTVFRVVDGQKRIPRETVETHVREIEDRMRFAVSVVEPGAEYAGTARIELVYDPAAPSLLVAPDEGWARLNVAWLASDKPTEAKIASRLRKQMWRATAYALGAGNSMYGPCLMQHIRTLSDLDGDTAKTICPEPYGKIMQVAEKIGLQPRIRVTYEQACREGWAPSPTNDVQRAIWERVQAEKERGPTNPILILPPNQKK